MSNSVSTSEDAKAPPPPPAPPLPPQGQGFVASALARVAQPFGYGSRPPTATGHRPIDPRDTRLSVQRSSRWAPRSLLRSLFVFPKVPQVPPGSQRTSTDVQRSPVSSRSTSHKTGIPIAALDISPDRTHAVLAGHNILKTIQVSDSACAEDFNLRTSIIAYAATHEASGNAIGGKHKDQWAANDVKWSHGQYSSMIATAAANGQIVVYDINRAGVEIARLHEHNRQVHRIGFNPYKGQLMLSGSQDGTIRLWDLRDLAGDRSVTTCQSRRKFSGNSDGIRDIRWSPADGMEFALGTDNGVIQRWDFRNDKTPLLRASAHENKTCYSIDWHPDGKHLVSAGADKNIKVWDFSSSDRRKKHIWEIRAPQAVLNVRWRPPCWSSNKQSPSRWQCTQVAASYNEQDPRIHIWDFRRPYVPFRTLDRYDTPATALLWHSEDLLWSVGTAGMFTQTDIDFIPKTMDQRSLNTLDIAADGQILFFSQKRERRRTSIEDVLEDLHKQNQRRGSTGERLAGSNNAQGSSEEPNWLNPSSKYQHRHHPASSRSTRSSTGTPPSAGSAGPVTSLDRSLQANNMHRFSQTGAIGYIEGVFDARAFKHLARSYKIPAVPTENVECNVHLILGDVLRANARFAAEVGQYRLSQSWLVLAEAVEQELRRRAECSYQQRTCSTATEQSTQLGDQLSANGEAESSMNILRTNISLLDIEGHRGNEESSNMTTPLARPLPDIVAESGTPSNMETLQLPNAKWTKRPLKPAVGVSELAKMTAPGSLGKEHHPFQIKEADTHSGPETGSHSPLDKRQLPPNAGFVDMDRQLAERRAAMGNYRAIPRPLLRLDDPIQMSGPVSNAPTFDRHDSNESFQLFSASTDSSHREQSTMGSFESNPVSQRSSSTPDRIDDLIASRNSITTDHEESALIFDEEAQPLSPVPAPVSAPKTSETSHGDGNNRSTASTNPSTSFRPANPQKPIVHTEDLEHCVRHSETPVESMKEETADALHHYILSDFVPSKERPAYLRPWHASNLFGPLIDYHTQKLYDSQMPTYLLLHLGRWLHHSMGHERAVLIFSHYHNQLTRLDLVNEAAQLRHLASTEFPELAEYGAYGIAPGGPFCTTCQKALKGGGPNFCKRCNQACGICPICQNMGPVSCPNPDVFLHLAERPVAMEALWMWCQNCGHGGHVNCMSLWWELDESQGACPTLGCACDCMPGTRRDEIIGKLEKQREEKQHVVTKDEWKAPESAAAQRARGLMGGKEPGPLGTGGGTGALSLATAGRSGSGGKRVRIVVPDEDSKENASKGMNGGKISSSAS